MHQCNAAFAGPNGIGFAFLGFYYDIGRLQAGGQPRGDQMAKIYLPKIDDFGRPRGILKCI